MSLRFLIFILLAVPALGQVPLPPMKMGMGPVRVQVTNYFAVTTLGGGLESDYSRETNLVGRVRDVTLAWNPVTNAAGYRVYWGTISRGYNRFTTVSNTTAKVLLQTNVVEVSVLGGGYTNVWQRFTNVTGSKLFRTRRDGPWVWMQVGVGPGQFFDVDVVRTNATASTKIRLAVKERRY